MDGKVTMSFVTKPEYKARLKKLAAATKRPMAFFLNYALEKYLDALEAIFVASEDVREEHSKIIFAADGRKNRAKN